MITRQDEVLMKKALEKSWAFSNLISLLQKHLFSYVEFKDFFDNMDTYIKDYEKKIKVHQKKLQNKYP